MPTEREVSLEHEVEDFKRRVAALETQLAAISRILRRILDLDEGSELDRELLLNFRAALAYAVKMQRREAETEDLLECVRGWRSSDTSRKASFWKTVRTIIFAIFTALAGAMATKMYGK